MAETDLCYQYLNSPSTDERMRFLKALAQAGELLPFSIVRDLMFAPLDPIEHIELLDNCDTSDKLAFEDLVTRGIYHWHPNVSSKALRYWAERTDCLLWHRTIPISEEKQLSQRLSYTLLDLAWHSGGLKIIEAFSKTEDLENMSPAFIALLYQRALTWSHLEQTLIDTGIEHFKRMNEIGYKADKVIPYIISYFLKFRPSALDQQIFVGSQGNIWMDIIKNLKKGALGKVNQKRLEKTIKSCQDNPSKMEKFFLEWPSIWNRSYLEDHVLHQAINLIAHHKITHAPDGNEIHMIFGGIGSELLTKSLQTIENTDAFGHGCKFLGNLLCLDHKNLIVEEVRSRVRNSEQPLPILQSIPQNYRIKISERTKGSLFDHILREQDQFLSSVDEINSYTFSFKPHTNCQEEDLSRQNFIKLRSGEIETVTEDTKSIWNIMGRSWIDPKNESLEEISKKARQSPAVFQLFYIETLGRFEGNDKAALKLLDFIRSDDINVIRLVIQALSSINTQRSLQELVSFLTRPNVNIELQMDIVQILSSKDLSQLQSELRSALDDLYSHTFEQGCWELKANIRDLIHIPATDSESQNLSITTTPLTTGLDLDSFLEEKIANYTLLSGEAKRALRTAQFFHSQVENAGDLTTIDLSPAIDMQYKALELSFRESFEAECKKIIQHGSLQRKLDIIGYARPIPPAMEEFESYIENLPIIKTIPFFSRFKLRKMLRALCQYRKGKRFTLDGLKAFGLFFICFSRKECKYGLANVFPITRMDDETLAEFVKSLHMFQDFRNRAAHEGFHPDASNDLEGIWQSTTSIIDYMFLVKGQLKAETEFIPAHEESSKSAS